MKPSLRRSSSRFAWLFALVAAAGFSCSRAPQSVSPPAKSTEAASVAAPDPRDAHIAELERELAVCRRELATRRANSAQSPAVASGTAAAAPSPAGEEAMKSAVADALARAGLKPMVAGLPPRDIGRAYGDWLDRLGLSPDRRARVEALLAERDRLNRLPPFGRPEDAQARADNAAALRREIGADGQASLEAYEQDMPAHAALADYEDRLAQAGLSLTADQRGPMLEALRAAGQDGVGNAGKFRVQLNPGESPADALQRAVDQSLHDWDQAAEAARNILTPAQYNEFDAYLGEQMSQRENMAATVGQLVGTLGAIPTNGNANIFIQSDSASLAAPAIPPPAP